MPCPVCSLPGEKPSPPRGRKASPWNARQSVKVRSGSTIQGQGIPNIVKQDRASPCKAQNPLAHSLAHKATFRGISGYELKQNREAVTLACQQRKPRNL